MAHTLLAKNAKLLVTMDDERREIPDGAIFARGNIIEQVGTVDEMPEGADEVVDLSGHIVLPGLINTHHHMYQSLTRAVPGAQNAELFDWLTTLYPIWARITPNMLQVSTRTAMAELLLSGCTTSSDHLYIFPNGCRLDDSIAAATDMGMRFHAARGSMSVGESKGGLPPDSVVEDEQFILTDTQRLINEYHDASHGSMLRIVVAPCSPFSVSTDLMRESATLARAHEVHLHTHLAESVKDVDYSREKFNRTPAEYADQLGWTGGDVWHAHCVQLDQAGIESFSSTKTGVAHCPSSNMRLASGIAPICRMRAAGVKVGLGVDGCASNDSGHMLMEAKLAMLLQRVAYGPASISARDALEMATLGGANVLGRDDVGALKAGMCADFVAFDCRRLEFSGANADLVAALIFCGPHKVAQSFVNGRQIIRDGELTTVELGRVIEDHDRATARLLAND